MTAPLIRSPKRSDLPDLVRIYNHYVRTTHITFDTHEKHGFRLVGTFREVGFKLERYWDVSWYEKDVSTIL